VGSFPGIVPNARIAKLKAIKANRQYSQRVTRSLPCKDVNKEDRFCGFYNPDYTGLKDWKRPLYFLNTLYIQAGYPKKLLFKEEVLSYIPVHG
jgi:hypothetical protein